MKIIGIDPGITGGIAVIENKKIISVYVMPTIIQENGKKIIDFKSVCEILKKNTPDVICLEKVGAGEFGGRVSMFNFGVSFGGLIATSIALGYNLKLITPQKWKKIVLGDKYDHKDKLGTIKFCQDIFPDINLLATKRSKVPHIGIVDAIAIGYSFFILNETVNE